MKITEDDLKTLGFRCEVVPPEESGDEYEWYYYTLDIPCISFISPASYEITDEEWYVEIFDIFPSMKIKDLTKLQSLITILKDIEKDQDISQ